MNDVLLDDHLSIMRGVIGRYPEEGQRFVFDFGKPGKQCIHMLFVRRPLKVTWYDGDQKVASKVLKPWTGFACYRADRVIEERP